MTAGIETFDRLAGAVLRLRSALSVTFVALAEIEACETLEQAKSRARAARHEARGRLHGERD